MLTIPEEFSAFVSDGVASGRFRSEEEAVAEGLRLLRCQERKRDSLRADLQEGLDHLDSGGGIPFDPTDIKRRGSERLSGAVS